MATAKMKIILPLVVWIWLITQTTAQSFTGIGRGIKRENFFLKLEDGIFACQVNETFDVLQVFQLSKLCDGVPDCFLGSDELRNELKCTDDCRNEDGTLCQNGVCIDNQCHCNDGFGGCSCEVPDENECKYRPCDVFSHCTNTLGSFSCTCFPGYQGDGFHCEDIDECADPAIASRCVENAECCNLPAHFLCKCKPGYEGDGESLCVDIDECARVGACGQNAHCFNTPGNYTCVCPDGYVGNPYDGCIDVDECQSHNACGPGAICTNVAGGKQCICPPGYEGDAYTLGCHDIDECLRSPCGQNALCTNLEGTFSCTCPPGFIGDPTIGCSDITCHSHSECSTQQACIYGKCQNPCIVANPCSLQQDCQIQDHQPVCVKVCQCQRATDCPGYGYTCDGCNCVRPTISTSPGVKTGCEHCPPGVACDPTTGACIKETSTTPATLTETQAPITKVPITTITVNYTTIQMEETTATISEITESSPTISEIEYTSKPLLPNRTTTSTTQIPGFEFTSAPLTTEVVKEEVVTVITTPKQFRTDEEVTTVKPPVITQSPDINEVPPLEITSSTAKIMTESTSEPKYTTIPPIEIFTKPEKELTSPSTEKPLDLVSTKNVTTLLSENTTRATTVLEPEVTEMTSEVPIFRTTPKEITTEIFRETSQKISTPEEPLVTPTKGTTQLPDQMTTLQVTTIRELDTVAPEIATTKEVVKGTTQLPQQMTTLQEIITEGPVTRIITSEGPKAGTTEEIMKGTTQFPEQKTTLKETTTEGPVTRKIITSEGPKVGTTEEAIKITTESPEQITTSQVTTTEGLEVITPKIVTSKKPEEATTKEVITSRTQLPQEATTLQETTTEGPVTRKIITSEEPKVGTTEESIEGVTKLPEEITTSQVSTTEGLEVITPKIVTSKKPEEGTTKEVITGTTQLPQETTILQAATTQETKTVTSEMLTEKIGTVAPEGRTTLEGMDITQSVFTTVVDKESSQYEEITTTPYHSTLKEKDITQPISTTLQTISERTTLPTKPTTIKELTTSVPATAATSKVVTEITEGSTAITPESKITTTSSIEEGVSQYVEKTTMESSTMKLEKETKPFETTTPYETVSTLSSKTTTEQLPFTSKSYTDTVTEITSKTKTPTISKEFTSTTPKLDQETEEIPAGYTSRTLITTEGFEQTIISNETKPIIEITTSGIETTTIPSEITVKPMIPTVSEEITTVTLEEDQGITNIPTGYTSKAAITTEAQQPTTIPKEIKQIIESTTSAIEKLTTQTELGVETTTLTHTIELSTEPTQLTTAEIETSRNITEVDTNITKGRCEFDRDCNPYEACLSNICTNPCTEKGVCASNAICTVHNHAAICMCPEGYSGDPKTNCLQEPPQSKLHKCTSDFDCLESEACYMSWCQNACEIPNICAETAKCQTKMHRPICTCPIGYEGNPAIKCFKPHPIGCTSNEDCPLTEACIGGACQRPCDIHDPCTQHAVCINTNHGSDCSCVEGYQGNGYVGCVPVLEGPPVCQYNEDCPPDKLCDRLNRRCINPCFEDSCGENADCIPKNHGTDCQCLPGFIGNPYVLCNRVQGCRSDKECSSSEACIAGKCRSPCKCGINANCEVHNHKYTCKCPPGYTGIASIECHPPSNPCDPNPCGLNALCELDNGVGPICYCPKGLTGNPFKSCIPEGDECTPNPCGPNTGCRVVAGKAICFCLPEFEGSPPHTPCTLPIHPCDPSPCGPNTQCTVLGNGFAKCTCLNGYIEDVNTIRGCREPINPCQPNPCGENAICDPQRQPVCYCPEGTVGNAFRTCTTPPATRCQPGPCGVNADCYVATNNQEQCFCKPGYIGDPYSGCRPKPPSPCLPNPCSPGAICIVSPNGQSLCQCPPGFGGDPTGPEGCHGFECLDDDDCSDKQACMAHRCRDPCPGACGINANCRAEKHHPVCTCNHGFTGNPIIRCSPIPKPLPPQSPCLPSPCGLNTICKVMGNRAVCSCISDFTGDPQFGCRPECVTNSDCSSDRTCINRHCISPCTTGNLCGLNAECMVEHHTPTCKCRQGFFGNAFIQCLPKPIYDVPQTNISRPCSPSPCGPAEVCTVYDGQMAICDPCLTPNAIYDPKCRPECLLNADCPFDKACIGQTCLDPCLGSCGFRAICTVVNHTPVCACPAHLRGNPFEQCVEMPQEKPMVKETCENVRCGANAICREENSALNCVCKPGFYGNPWVVCRPVCVIDPDCPQTQACVNNKCVDPCIAVCGVNAQCKPVHHSPICYCPEGYNGDAFVSCYPDTIAKIPPTGINPCDPSPCGPFSRCLISSQGFPTCSCLPTFKGIPPACRPECVVSSECPQNKGCVNQKCVDPCPGTCGNNAICSVINHNPICYCRNGFQGDPFISCIATGLPSPVPEPRNPCDVALSPCGPNSICLVKEDRPVCSCIANYIGTPPHCRPECVRSSECPKTKACVQEKCVDPCVGACGRNAECNIINHRAFCTCTHGFEGDAFVGCTKTIDRMETLCNPSPCGQNTMCTVENNRPVCKCIPPYIGNPYTGGCKPECISSAECPSHESCLNNYCRNPCEGLCGVNTECRVVNHNPQCNCFPGFIGNPYTSCRQEEQPKDENPCQPSPCGPNSNCRISNGHPICSCSVGFYGVPPRCRPECVITSECSNDKECINQKCQDPCPGTCGLEARCEVINHSPICSCPPRYTGDPFIQCIKEESRTPTPPPTSPCIPSPCGLNAECRVLEDRPVCSCLPGLLGAPPNCRPECVINQDCPPNLSCINKKCQNPCDGSCGINAQCTVLNHKSVCLCLEGYEGDPFSGCRQMQATTPTPELLSPCIPNPCGPNAQCRENKQAAACYCNTGFEGNPYDTQRGCRRECENNDDCNTHLACVNFKCVDPCPGICGLYAECRVESHIPKCFCQQGYTGNAFVECRQILMPPPPEPTTTERPPSCFPSPCGPNAQCQMRNGFPSCSCLPSFVGSPPNCRPECIINSECSSSLACIQQKCKNPCEGSCGYNANCHVLNHLPICTCEQGFTGDPFTQCSQIVIERVPEDPCANSPCGPNAKCDNGVCTCLPEFFGNPYESCRPECVLSNECSRDKACTRNKCIDPCPGTCGLNARCDVINHIPTCSCPEGMTGDPFSNCRIIEKQEAPPSEPCNPSPCGPNSICRAINDHATCSCIQGFTGSPPNCKPECVISAECTLTQACVNQKCVNPCAGTCGLEARCEVINHSPICSCPESLTGDPFQRCYPIPAPPPIEEPQDPCRPSPCGPNAICRNVGGRAQCDCLPDYIGQAPNCRPECVINPDCPSTKACIGKKCRDPCVGSCGQNTECHVISHTVSCSCLFGYTGDPFTQCIPITRPEPNPCEPSPCGANAVCKERNNAGSCVCLDEYHGNPYEGCRPECAINSDCEKTKACVRNKCVDPCPGICGQFAECQIVNHIPTCNCIKGYIGDPFAGCRIEPVKHEEPTNPCFPSPCGPNSICRNINNRAVCSCEKEYVGAPPNCRPECVVSSECPSNKACYKFKCSNPCNGACGIGAKCEVINHNPLCSCPIGLTGDPFTRCVEQPPVVKPPEVPPNPCYPSPCGPNAECRQFNDQPSCSCNPGYIGSPPNCRPECVVNTDCPSDKACISEKCRDPCSGSCGFNAECRVHNHIPICTCISGFVGDPFTQCTMKVEEPVTKRPRDPCEKQPCGPNAQCNNGICKCLPEYFGDPYRGCRPECTMNTDCSPTKACSNLKCIDPCIGTCGTNAKCDVVNHIPMCSCLPSYEGDPFTTCRRVEHKPPVNPCNPSPCGANSICKIINEVAVCSCQPGQIGSPPSCRPECIISAECPLTQACLNNKCSDPCPGTCGINAKCQVINHNPICTCMADQTGDPFTRCYPIQKEPPQVINPCEPSPCGPNSVCQVHGENPACSCLPNYVGSPPNCRPECVINPECASNRACVNQKCRDPCPGSCGPSATCAVINHNPVCTCITGYTGDPFVGCVEARAPPTIPPKVDPCYPSPCGSNAICRVENSYGVCQCLPEYHGNPYEGCRPECVGNSDCPMNRACIRNKCEDPCPGTCGVGATCDVRNHIPICSCPTGFIGDAFRQCLPSGPEPSPCQPSPCGLNTICKEFDNRAVCECLPGLFGNPSTSGCKPECTISADCPLNKACSNMKCIDPCPGVCGFNAQCNVINHSPVCTCPLPLIGNPFTLCKEQQEIEIDLCNPSPCNINGQCQVVNGAAICIYPECIINQDCPRDKACYNQKCRDPCRDACGYNALCQVINHKAICTCPNGYGGIPEIECKMQAVPIPRPECIQDSDCANDKACINEKCLNPCTSSPGLCGYNAECRVQTHRAICICKGGFTGNAQTACVEIGCRSDSDCPPVQACVNRECVDPCSYTQCGLNAFCRPDSFHKARCYCPDRFRGDPQIRCERPECNNDQDCPYKLACRNERCEDPCRCGQGAICTVYNHKPQCSCPPGFNGNPLVACSLSKEDIPECKIDADCPSKYACFSGSCKNPCIVAKACGINAECTVVDTLPLRTMSCSCLAGYVGDAGEICRAEREGCKTDSECSLTTTCINGECINPCVAANPCVQNAHCEPLNHKAVCKCPAGLVGNPFISCSPVSNIEPECTRDSDCSNDKSCINQRCKDPCISNPCGTNADCQTSFHRPACYCPDGLGGDPQVMCYRPECKVDDDCPYNKACINSNCLNPCTTTSCGQGAQCITHNHRAQCQCPAGSQGNPLVSCITGVCQYNEDCADYEACDRLNRVCRPVCDDETCGDNARCVGENHQPKCKCPPGKYGNPYVECKDTEPRVPLPSPECTTDSECSSQFACINTRCQNLCAISDFCSIDQECRVWDTLPLRTFICQCPPDTFKDESGKCKPIATRGCTTDSECDDSKKCIQGSCINACSVDQCGINALCAEKYHQAICTCPPGHNGNPHVECTRVRIPLPPTPECYSDDECSSELACRNQICVNPCSSDKVCAIGALCSVSAHIPNCNCPLGYEGNPRIECVPPKGPVAGCKQNSDCAGSQACINARCASPCNCGPNAECRVAGHYPTCYCRPGYSGNPQIGCTKLECETDNECNNDKQCYNGQCVNPCILGDPCASNAECYGHNHRANCKCLSGYIGNPLQKCELVECHVDNDCPLNRACIQHHCIDPCSSIANPPCAQNAICYVQNHAAGCRCPTELPEGNPLSYCYASVIPPECRLDMDCPSKLACIKNTCVNPCTKLSPCHPTSKCSVLDTVPVRTMTCTCPEGWVPNENDECHPLPIPPPGCVSDTDCPSNEACVNRICKNPCNCGKHSACFVENHRPVCSCENGFEGNPEIACYAVGCRTDSECQPGKSCVNSQCVNPCLVNDRCGINAQCHVNINRAECRCLSGYRGNPYDRCLIIGCTSNNDCSNDKQCINAQCINPCIFKDPCSAQAECRVQNHLAVCRCPPGFIGNPYVDCRREPEPECRLDTDCPPRLACVNQKCKDPCAVFLPCSSPSECQVANTVPVRTMICVCPAGYISSGSGTCQPTKSITRVSCISDNDCAADKSCVQGICKNPCNCGHNADCRIKDHKPICTCKQGYIGNPEIECTKIGCRSDSDCSSQHACINRQCTPACPADKTVCGKDAECYGINHRAICECPPGLIGNPKINCLTIGCRADSECPSSKSCINQKCKNPCEAKNPCDLSAECKVFNHQPICACPPGFNGNPISGCFPTQTKCKYDSHCPSQTVCIGGECINPCIEKEPCGINAVCTVLNTEPVRTMICQCKEGYQGNAAVQCDKTTFCRFDKGYIIATDGICKCPPNTGLNENDECVKCLPERGFTVERGRCVCNLEKGWIIDERGKCVCPTEFGYKLDASGACKPKTTGCYSDDECADNKYCNLESGTCENPCIDPQQKICGLNAFCNATNHRAVCVCLTNYYGNAEDACLPYKVIPPPDFPPPQMNVKCLSDGVQVDIDFPKEEFNGVLYVKGHSKDEECRRSLTISSTDTEDRKQDFKVHFGSCGLVLVNGNASFILVIQKHPKLVTYKARAFHIKCIYQTGEQNVTLGFNVSMITTAGTIANTGPPPTCLMRIVTKTGQEISAAEIGDELKLEVEVQPGSIYGGFARSCVAKTMEGTTENTYIVTDENGCATDQKVFGDWDYNTDTESLQARFSAFKFPSSDNIKFQCNIRVCFGKCQPVNCQGYNAFGRRKRAIDYNDTDSDVALQSDTLNGQLREEITIHSNTILTFERREERLVDPTESPLAQRVDDICVSMIGFIIALIITALLALVAVAVAVSCWLMAYRRRPKATGPLPHPPEFPNPLFTTPEPMAEPSPDYLT